LSDAKGRAKDVAPDEAGTGLNARPSKMTPASSGDARASAGDRRRRSATPGTIARAAIVLVAALAALAPAPASVVERYYSETFYPALQPRLTALTNLVPIAVLDVLVAGAAVWVLVEMVRAFRRPRLWLPRLGGLAVRLAVASAAAYLLFLVFWGLNYRRPRAAERFNVDRGRVTPEALRSLASRSSDAVNAAYGGAGSARDDGELVERLAAAFGRLGAARSSWAVTPGRPKLSAIAHTFPWSGVDGMINPLGLEVLLNPEVLPFERPFVLAHEWAHLAGHASEDEASFVGWLTCLAGDRSIQYSGWLGLYLHVLRALPPEERRAALARLDPGPREDLRAIQRRLARVQPLVQEASWEVYDRYLRANRVPGGVANYDEVITLVLGSPIAWPHWRGD